MLQVCAAEKPPSVRGDGATDDTAALQSALNAIGKAGGTLELPPGQYLLRGALKIPTGVTLQGSWQAPHHGAYDKGTTLLITNGRGDEKAAPSLFLEQSSALRGVTLLWPEQKWPNIVAYPWAIYGRGMHNTVENVTLVNAYNGIKIGGVMIAGEQDAKGKGENSELHLIRNVFGCVLRRGVFVDETTDIGRLENVHFNPHYWRRSNHPSAGKAGDLEIAGYMVNHLEAFIFGRSDWQEASSCFVFGAKIGYRFIRTTAGACNGEFTGIGADFCRTCVQIDELQRLGVHISNGTFAASGGAPGTIIMTSPMAGGAARFHNCAFWEAPNGVAQLDGLTSVSLSDCQIFSGSQSGAIRARAGWLMVRGCEFEGKNLAIDLGPDVRSAIISGNLQQLGLKVRNAIGERAQIGLNQEAPEQNHQWPLALVAAAFSAIVFVCIALIVWRRIRRAAKTSASA